MAIDLSLDENGLALMMDVCCLRSHTDQAAAGKTKLERMSATTPQAAMSSERDIQRRFRFTRDCDCDGYCDWSAVRSSSTSSTTR